MSTYTKINLSEITDLAPTFGMDEMGEARFAREALGAEGIGLSYYRMNPGRRVGFGHHHTEDEEVYLVLGGSGRFRIDDEIIDIGLRDLVFCQPSTMREWEAGADGLQLVAFGSHAGDDAEMQPGWWTD